MSLKINFPNRHKNLTKLSDVGYGQCFEYDGKYYIVPNHFNEYHEDGSVLVYCLNTNNLVSLSLSEGLQVNKNVTVQVNILSP